MNGGIDKKKGVDNRVAADAGEIMLRLMQRKEPIAAQLRQSPFRMNQPEVLQPAMRPDASKYAGLRCSS